MTEIKLNLNVVLPGRTMLSKEECLKTIQKTVEKTSKKSGKTYKKTIKVQVEDTDKMDKHSMRVMGVNNTIEVITFHTRKTKPAFQSLNISKESYYHMISNECPYWSKIKVWNSMSKKERLEAHLQRITEGLGGISYTYQIFED